MVSTIAHMNEKRPYLRVNFACGILAVHCTHVSTGTLKNVIGDVSAVTTIAKHEVCDDHWVDGDNSFQLLQGRVSLQSQHMSVTQIQETQLALRKPPTKEEIRERISDDDYVEEIATTFSLRDPAGQEQVDALVAKKIRHDYHSSDGSVVVFELTWPRAYGLLTAFAVILALILIGQAPDGFFGESVPSQAPAILAAANHLPKLSETPKSYRTGVLACDGNYLVGPEDLDAALDSKDNIVDAIMTQVRLQADRVALIDGESGMSMTYKQLGKAIEDIAAALAAKGIRRGETIAVFLPPSPALAVALLGIMHAECAWLTLDPELPVQRLQTLLTAVNSRLSLGFKYVEGLHSFPMWLVDTLGKISAADLNDPLCRSSCSTSDADDHVAIFFTSGSSGVPKGVKYSARTLLHGVLSMRRLCDMNESTVALMKTPTIWAVIEYEIFPALVSGGVVVCDSRCQKNLQLLAETLSDHKVTALMTSAPVMRALVEGTWRERSDLRFVAASHLKHVVNVGGALPLETCALMQNALPTSSVHNLYGCTESSCTEWTYKQSTHLAPTSGNAPAGWPQPRVDVFVVDEKMEQLSIGQEGEVCFGSEFNSLGYFGDASLTDMKFRQHPTKLELRMYRTGDLGAFVPDPTCPDRLVLQITGRIDRQLNIAGVRVAPEEVEGVIEKVSGVTECVVVAAESVLVAFVVGERTSKDLVAAIKSHCTENLPARMWPELIFDLEAFPRLRNGKVDLANLSARAKQAVQEDLKSAVDSLGMMKNVNKDVLREMNVFSATRCFAMLEVCLFHWFWGGSFTHMFSANLVSTEATTFAPGWLRWFIRGTMCSQWAMYAFVLMSARTDRQAAEERKPGQIREACVVVAMMMFGYEALGYLVQLMNDVMKNGMVVEHGADHLWYFGLFMTLKLATVCVLMPFEKYVRTLGPRPCEIARFLFVAGVLIYQCTWHHWPRIKYSVEHHIFYVGIDKDFFDTWSWTLYIVAFFYQAPFVSWVLRSWPKKPGWLLPMSLFLVGNCVLGYLDEQQKPLHIWRLWCPVAFPQLLFDLCLLGLLMLSLYFLSDGPWLHRFGLIRMGTYSLSFYVLHFFFLAYRSPPGEYGVWFKIGNFGPPCLHDAVISIRPTFGGIGQLVVLLMYPVVFGLTVAPFFQWSFLGCFLAVEKGFMRIVSPIFGRWLQ
eukprot:TRINITY_DN27722_c0_g5_i1.p1 TRINITY_DN27722_c0_g5~~TRINITY_DN27722_c0_g5_i1.p1  ORF type:complete len:1175 (+),score=127.73 TRINITY_DN27722_c0_g5_i1:86-3610(+)